MDIQETIDIRYEEIEGLQQKLSEDHYMNPEQEDELEELIAKAIKFGELCAQRDAKAKAVPEWISVQDRMPEQGQKVLVFRPDAHNYPHKDPNFKICTYAGADIFINSHFEHVITHWKPLESPIEVQEPDND